MISRSFVFLSLLLSCSFQKMKAVEGVVDVFSAKEFFIESGGAKLFCKMIGKGKPLLVIHGGPGLTHDYLMPHLARLAEDHFLIFFDQRGCGRSSGELHKESINIETYVADMEHIRQELKLDKISILGHSWGAILAMHYALTHPRSVDKLVLSNSVPADYEGFQQFIQEWLHRTAPHRKALSMIEVNKEFQEGDPKLFEQFNQIIFRTYCYIPERADLLSLQMTRSAIMNYFKIYALFEANVFKTKYNLHASLQTLNIPALIIHGEADPVPSAQALKIHESIPKSRYILLKECGHFPFIEQPDHYLNALKDFLK